MDKQKKPGSGSVILVVSGRNRISVEAYVNIRKVADLLHGKEVLLSIVTSLNKLRFR